MKQPIVIQSYAVTPNEPFDTLCFSFMAKNYTDYNYSRYNFE
ncbi:hypothetical protein HMPREF1141_3297 [Clostridium sp. MSTE9]|nr:hypothetical protein HMPREF1141_3297 [Clostridium sp. MSTE9]